MTRSRHHTPKKKQPVRAGRQGPDPLNPRTRRRKANPETGVVAAVRDLLTIHPAVAWCERINSGATIMHGRFITFGFKGCADIIGQTTKAAGGVFMAVEVKGERKYPSKDQRRFLANVEAAGGFACWARSVDEVHVALERWLRLRQAHQMSLNQPAAISVVPASRHLTPLR